jgi:hypothetical protein
MGLLDDAIREHLELKRRHGADPDEVARQEREALGAPRRGEFAQPEGAAAVEDVPRAAVAAPDEPVEPSVAAAEPPPSAPEEARAAEAATAALPPEPEPELEEPPPAEPAPGYEEDPWLPDEDQVPADETLEHPAPAPPGDEREDVLEETPEFLQETPEHDRLWFEQKPPRGFDWDK